ncbi:MAG: Gp19/Gp15/Gp42 family protein [Eubacteriales bacterium]|nr:Gp19/Gp15/Gp42 family protein [Eubacteriales bacterium]
MADFATPADVQAITGKTYTETELTRIGALLPLISDALRNEAARVGKDLDAMAAASGTYASVVKMVTIDVVVRVLRQSQEGEPLSQESRGALGYTWSGTYAIPGGGISGAIMRNDLKRLGLKKQKIGVIELWDLDSTE